MKLFSTEQVSKYHPDKYADQISDAILDACLAEDKDNDPTKEEFIAKIAIETKGVTVISKADCENLIVKIGELLGGAK